MVSKNGNLQDYVLPEGFICKWLEMNDSGMLFVYCDNGEGNPVVIMLKRGKTALVPLLVDLPGC